jgi:hypothetical protein
LPQGGQGWIEGVVDTVDHGLQRVNKGKHAFQIVIVQVAEDHPRHDGIDLSCPDLARANRFDERRFIVIRKDVLAQQVLLDPGGPTIRDGMDDWPNRFG